MFCKSIKVSKNTNGAAPKMYIRPYPVNEYGIVVKMDELDCDVLYKYFIDTVDWNSLSEPEKVKLITVLLCYEHELYLEVDQEDGVICHKYAYGRGLRGYFIPLLGAKHRAIDVNFKKDIWVIMRLPVFPALFGTAYRDENALLEQMKGLYSKFIKSKDFDYKNRLVNMQGVIWG